MEREKHKRKALRQEKVVRLRNAGMTYSDIGKEIDVSRDRARQIYQEAIRKPKEIRSELGGLWLPERAMNALKSKGITSIADIQKLNAVALLKIPNFGRKSLDALNAGLSNMGLPTIDVNPNASTENHEPFFSVGDVVYPGPHSTMPDNRFGPYKVVSYKSKSWMQLEGVNKQVYPGHYYKNKSDAARAWVDFYTVTIRSMIIRVKIFQQHMD